MENKENSNPALRIGIRALIVIIILAILFILSLGIIKLVPKALDGIQSLRDSSSVNSNKQEVLTVAPERTAVKTGENITISWNHTNIKNEDGYYAFRYECRDSISFSTSQGGAIIPCNVDFPLNSSSSQITYSSTGQKSILLHVEDSSKSTVSTPNDIMIFIKYVNPSTGGVYASGVTKISVQNISSLNEVSVTKPSSKPSVTSTAVSPAIPVRHANTGPADFQVKILSTGFIDPQTNRMVSSSSFYQGQKVALLFQISNIGGQPTGNWNFIAQLPSDIASEANYISPVQSSLQPGGSVLYTLGFDPSTQNQGVSQSATITIDPNTSVDTNGSNNTATTLLNFSNIQVNGSGSDLAIVALQPGYIASNGQFIQSTSNSYSNSAIKLTVANQGSRVSGNWSFTSSIQNPNGYTAGNSYNSGSLLSLQPNGTQSFIINLSQLSGNTNSVIVTIDPNNQTQDINRNNNTATAQIYGSYNNSYSD